MRALGMLTAAILAATAVGALVVGVKSAPDVQRYLRIRAM
jgi:hypothetical protein